MLIKTLSLNPLEYIKEQFKNNRHPIIHTIGRSSNEYILFSIHIIEHISSVLKFHCNFQVGKWNSIFNKHLLFEIFLNGIKTTP
jgi:hypothetical protein